MRERPSIDRSEPPVFGPSGVVLNAATMTDEMRAEIEENERAGLIDLLMTAFFLSLALVSLFILPVFRAYNLHWVFALMIIAAFFISEKIRGTSFVRAFWRVFPIIFGYVFMLGRWLPPGLSGVAVIVLFYLGLLVEKKFFPLRTSTNP